MIAYNDVLELLADNIQRETCIVLLGPSLSVDLQDKYREFLLSKQETYDIEIDHESFVLFHNKAKRQLFYTGLKRFYEEHAQPLDIHRKLVQIPFHLLLSTAADLRTQRAWEQSGLEYSFQFYDKRENPRDIERPTAAKPLLYNLFGSVQEPDSLVVSYDDLFKFLFAILRDKQLPRELDRTIKSSKVFLFLGFDFEQWFLKIILRLFNLHEEPSPFANEIKDVQNEITRKSWTSENNKNFFIKNFNMEFIDVNVEELVNDLFDKCKNNLRETKPAADNPIINTVVNHIKSDDLEKALESLEDYLEGKDYNLYDRVITLSGALSNLKRKMGKQTISQQDADVEKAKLRENILHLLDDIKMILKLGV